MGRPRSKPIKYDAEVGLSLYRPTSANNKYRLDYIDPLTGARHQPRRCDELEAFALWDDTLTYLQAARFAEPASTPAGGPASAPTVRDLFDRLAERWRDDDRTDHYINTRYGRFDYRLAPVFGDQPVRDWAASNDGCREVLRVARVHGLRPSTIQDLGALMRRLVTHGHELRWIPAGRDPMRGIRYTAGSREQGQSPEFVTEADRPEFAAVEKLVGVYEELAVETGISWLPVRALIASQGGLRPGEQDALRVCDIDADKLVVNVASAFTWPRGSDGPTRKLPKNNKRRRVLLPGSTIERLAALVERRLSDGAAHNDLLFEDPRRVGLPLSESATRKLHTAAALRAGWETVAVRRQETSRRHLGPDLRPRHPNYSLRHHAAVWMHEVAGFDWTDVSQALGHHSVAFTHAVYVRSGSEAESRNRDRLRRM